MNTDDKLTKTVARQTKNIVNIIDSINMAFDELIQNEKSHGHINHGTI